jgi:putative CocE/NonD family hydrolase
MGPWPHGLTFSDMVGGLHFGFNARGALGQVVEYYLRFYDKYVKEMEVDLPVVRYFVMTENQWHEAPAWPLPETDWQRFYLRSAGRANSSAGDGFLSRESPGLEPADIFVYDPRFPVPTTGGRNLRLLNGPQDQSHIEARHDILVYSSPPLEDDLEVSGPLRLHLFASSSARDTDFVAKLVDVYPDGRSFNVAEGIVRARFWKSSDQPDLLTSGEVREYIIDLAASSNLFLKGHRLRLDVTSSNFPRFDRNLNTGNPIGTEKAGVPALQTILHETGQASYIDLPVIPRQK